MLIVFRHDDTAQVIIHTSNMIPFDWENMAQAAWRSPMLPKRKSATPDTDRIGSGSKFKTDLLNYLRAYDGKRTICKPLIEELSQYDFSEVRAAIVASVPGKQSVEKESETSWGWAGLRDVLKSIPVQGGESEVVVQISSIATLGGTDKWLDQTLFKTMRISKNIAPKQPTFRVIFPTADEIRRSLNGYQSGSAIHTKIHSAAQTKQLQYLKPVLCHWAGDGAHHQSSSSSAPIQEAGRRRAAPHIKTFIRFADAQKTSIDWMLVTSANLSKQAWGEATNAGGDVRICSFEIGVVVWPELYGGGAKMVPTFKTDTPAAAASGGGVVVGARMPYDLPLVPYAKTDVPWCASASYDMPDWMGQTWNVG
jgi:tyrosyl-DNA phosphodiesterase-1